MKLKQAVLQIILGVVNWIVSFFPIKQDQITFVSLESNQLHSDLLQIYLHLKDDYQIRCVLTKFTKNNLWTNFLYMFNTIKQAWYINQSALVILNDNNYVVSTCKRKGVKVMQVWHASGAIKKFGNCLERKYPITSYDYVLANSEYWIEPYSQAFGVTQNQVYTTGMPRVDCLFDEQFKIDKRQYFLDLYPVLKDKNVILYAPTFRGNIYDGFSSINIDLEALSRSLGDEYYILYKYHPLLKEQASSFNEYIIDVSQYDIHELFMVSDMLMSDYSSIIFDYSILQKPMIFYVPDLQNYINTVGCFVDYNTMPGAICSNIIEVKDAICNPKDYPLQQFRDQYFIHQDGKNIDRVIKLIEEIIKTRG